MPLSRQERRLADKRKRSGKTPYPGATQAIFAQLKSAIDLHMAGRLIEAEASYRTVLAEEPDHPHALNLLGVLACELNSPENGCKLIGEAIGLNGQIAEYHSNYAEALLQAGRPADAAAAARKAISLDRSAARPHLTLGVALRQLGEGQKAVASFADSLTLAPAEAEAQNGFARSCVEFGVIQLDARTEPLLLRALDEGWTRPSDLATCLVATFRRVPPVAELLAMAHGDDGGARIASALADGSLAAVLSTPLLHAFFASGPIADPGFERLLGHVRRAALDAVAAGRALSPKALELMAAIARGCFLADYALAESAPETEIVERLIAEGMTGDRLAVIAAYRPLWQVVRDDRPAGPPVPPALESLMQLQLVEPRLDRSRAASIPQLTPIAAGVSERVREQYEESPYPRWTRIGMVVPGPTLQAHLRRAYAVKIPDAAAILVAGCGTGQEPIELALKCHGTSARILAVDLSRASLAHAIRHSETLGLGNLRFGQADILRLDTLDERFDLVVSSGVLHHLADPAAGWRILAGLLKPGGLMKISLYSEVARRSVVAARELIARRGWPPTPAGIREARTAILALPDDDPARAVLRSPDFYGFNTCRDLLFHVQEHRFTIPMLAQLIAALDLRFIGFEVDALSLARFRLRFPEQDAATDLDKWHLFEIENPDTFGSMYHFWVAAESHQ